MAFKLASVTNADGSHRIRRSAHNQPCGSSLVPLALEAWAPLLSASNRREHIVRVLVQLANWYREQHGRTSIPASIPEWQVRDTKVLGPVIWQIRGAPNDGGSAFAGAADAPWLRQVTLEAPARKSHEALERIQEDALIGCADVVQIPEAAGADVMMWTMEAQPASARLVDRV